MTSKKEMKTYQIEIIETISALVEIVAEDGGTAMLKAREMYRNEEVILYPDDLIDTKYNVFAKV